MNNCDKGKLGEKLAVKHLKSVGYEITEVNYRYKRYGEIDIIAKQGQWICFIEVKTRLTDLYGIPSEAIDCRKINQIKKVSTIYLLKNELYDADIRFDAVEVFIDSKVRKAKVHIIKNAF